MNNQVFKEESVALKRSHSARPTTRAVDFTGAVKDNPASNDSIDDSDNNECEEIRASECFEEIDQVMKKLSELSEPLAIDYIIESNEDRLTPTNEISPEASEGIFKNSNDSLDCQEIVLSEPLAIDAVIESNEGRLTKPNETSHEVPEGIKFSNDSLESEERVDDEAPHLQECITEIQLASLSSNQKLVAFSEDEAPKKNRTCLPKDDIGARLDRALDNSAKSVGTRLSSELIPLTKDYQAFRRKLPTMIKAAKKYLEVTSQREQHRTQLFHAFAALSKGSPLHPRVGEVLEARTIENLVKLEGYGETLSKVDSKSLLGLQQISEYVHNKQSVVEYQDNVLGFATEWERVVTKRVDEDLKNVKGLQKTKRHYEIKVERLRRRTNKLESKRRAVPKALEEKLVRNEDKLQGMYEIHEEEAHKLCMLIECVTQHSWTELQQLINNTLQWEMERLNRENSVYSQRNLKSISEGIKQSGTHKY